MLIYRYSKYYGFDCSGRYSDPYTLVNRIQDLVKDLITAAASHPNPHIHSDSMGSPEDSNATGEDGNEDDQDDEGDSELDQPCHCKAETAAPPALSLGICGLSSQISFPPPKADLLQAPLYLAPLKEAEKQVQEQTSSTAATASAAAATGALASSSTGPPSSTYLSTLATSRQVSSQGCSRVFIIKGQHPTPLYC